MREWTVLTAPLFTIAIAITVATRLQHVRTSHVACLHERTAYIKKLHFNENWHYGIFFCKFSDTVADDPCISLGTKS